MPLRNRTLFQAARCQSQPQASPPASPKAQQSSPSPRWLHWSASTPATVHHKGKGKHRRVGGEPASTVGPDHWQCQTRGSPVRHGSPLLGHAQVGLRLSMSNQYARGEGLGGVITSLLSLLGHRYDHARAQPMYRQPLYKAGVPVKNHATRQGALSGGAGLASVAQAKAVCMHVVAGMPAELRVVHTATGAAGCIIDQSVYNSNQQLRPWAASSWQMTGCCSCKAAVLKTRWSACHSRAPCGWPQLQSLADRRPARVCCTHHQQLHGGQQHHTLRTGRGSEHPSIYVHTDSTACMHAQHKSARTRAWLDRAAAVCQGADKSIGQL